MTSVNNHFIVDAFFSSNCFSCLLTFTAIVTDLTRCLGSRHKWHRANFQHLWPFGLLLKDFTESNSYSRLHKARSIVSAEKSCVCIVVKNESDWEKGQWLELALDWCWVQLLSWTVRLITTFKCAWLPPHKTPVCVATQQGWGGGTEEEMKPKTNEVTSRPRIQNRDGAECHCKHARTLMLTHTHTHRHCACL